MVARQEAHFAASTQVTQGALSLSVADQSDHGPDPKADTRALSVECPRPASAASAPTFTLAPLGSAPQYVAQAASLRHAHEGNPVITRSRIIARSNSAKTPSIWNIARPKGWTCRALLMQEQIDPLRM